MIAAALILQGIAIAVLAFGFYRSSIVIGVLQCRLDQHELAITTGKQHRYTGLPEDEDLAARIRAHRTSLDQGADCSE